MITLSSQETITGTVERVIHYGQDYTVFKLQTHDGLTVIVVGPATDIAPGLEVRATGTFQNHPRYGMRFRASTALVLPPEGRSGILAYLSSGKVKGIGKALARRLMDHFGDRTREALDAGPEKLCEVPGIGKGRALAICEAWRRETTKRETFILLVEMGLTPAQAQRLMRVLGDEAPARVKQDPYGLTKLVPGIGFKTADAIATRVGLPPDSPARLKAAVIHVLQDAAEQGHVFLERNTLISAACALTGQSEAMVHDAVISLTASQAIVIERGPDGADVAYEAGMYRTEMSVAARLYLLMSQPCERLNVSINAKLAQSQQDALYQVTSSPVAVLTGGPGTGKTTIVGALISSAKAQGLRVALAAPTGRAAMRLKEATGYEAKTVHRLLEFNPRTLRFGRDETHPLETDLVVVDEASMLDLIMIDRLLRAVSPGTRVIFVGDSDQLPPVGPGDPFRDIIASKAVTVARLKEVFRQESGSLIVTNAHRVLGGQMPINSPRSDQARDFHIVFREEPGEVASTVVQLVCERIPAHFGLDPVRDVQTIAPMHRGECGTESLNAALRQRLVPGSEGRRFAPGDRVIQNRNDYELEVFNGDIGTVSEVFSDGSVKVQFDDREVLYPPDATEDLGLAYAITVHKAQGSEFDAVVIALHTQHYMMLRRNLFYTAITRGKKLVVVVCSQRALRIAVQDARSEQRNTMLAERLRALAHDCS